MTSTETDSVRVPLIWSTEKKRFLIDTASFQLVPNERIEIRPRELQMEGNATDGFQLTIGASRVRQL